MTEVRPAEDVFVLEENELLRILSNRQRAIMLMLYGAPGLTTETIAELLETPEDEIEDDMAELARHGLVDNPPLTQ